MDFETVKRDHANIRRKMARCKGSGDLKRLQGLRDQLERVRQNIDEIKPHFRATDENGESRVERAEFRRSYGYESFMEGLFTKFTFHVLKLG